ncbi:MAG: hypothetical protein QM784_35775 [Polyangiaceae bacterium]
MTRPTWELRGHPNWGCSGLWSTSARIESHSGGRARDEMPIRPGVWSPNRSKMPAYALKMPARALISPLGGAIGRTGHLDVSVSPE